MSKGNLYQPFEIESKSIDVFSKAAHRNDFFELIYIMDGTGVQWTNDNRFDYRQGNLLLLTLQDANSFEIKTTTDFFFLRFIGTYIKSKTTDYGRIERIDFILRNASHRPAAF